MINDNLVICVPTYKRKNPKILKMVADNPNVEFHFCVRRELYEQGFYQHLLNIKNIRIVPFNNLTNIGNTRREIVNFANWLGKKYCMMIDDTQTEIYDYKKQTNDLKIITDDIIQRFEEDNFQYYAASFTIGKRKKKEQHLYFQGQLCQVFILNLEVLNRYGINFKDCDEVGIEDLAFNIDCIAKGLINLSDSRYVRRGLPPCLNKEGGNHHESDNYDEQYLQNRILTLKVYDLKFKMLKVWFEDTYKSMIGVQFNICTDKLTKEKFLTAGILIKPLRIILIEERFTFTELILHELDKSFFKRVYPKEIKFLLRSDTI